VQVVVGRDDPREVNGEGTTLEGTPSASPEGGLSASPSRPSLPRARAAAKRTSSQGVAASRSQLSAFDSPGGGK